MAPRRSLPSKKWLRIARLAQAKGGDVSEPADLGQVRQRRARRSHAVDLADVFAHVDDIVDRGGLRPPWPTGFSPLDPILGGGLRSGELLVIGGTQGVGKTTMALQFAQQSIVAGSPVLYVTYEHEPVTMLERVIACTAGDAVGSDAFNLREVRQAFEAAGGGSLRERLRGRIGGVEALEILDVQLPKFHVLRGRYETDLATVGEAAADVAERHGMPPLVVLDYLQKVSPGADHAGAASSPSEDERLVRVANGAKDLALDLGAPVVAVSAGDREGIKRGRRMRAHHLRGSGSLAYEADVILILNSKYDVVSRNSLVFGAADASRFRGWVVLTVEKNRGGQDFVDMEFRARFEQCRFDREGRPVEEKLVDERIDAVE